MGQGAGYNGQLVGISDRRLKSPKGVWVPITMTSFCRYNGQEDRYNDQVDIMAGVLSLILRQ